MAQDQQRGAGQDGDGRDDVYKVERRTGEVRGVGAQKFDPETSEGEPYQVEEDEVAVAQAFAEKIRNVENQGKADQVPQQFVEEQGMEAHAGWIEQQVVVRGDAELWIDAQTPGQGGGRPGP